MKKYNEEDEVFNIREKAFLEIAQTLQKAREELSYSIDDIADITKITKNNLRLLEKAQFDQLPGLVYICGFIRNYARVLKINGDILVQKLTQNYHKDNYPPPETKKSEIKNNSLSSKLLHIIQYNLSFFIILPLIAILILLIFYFYQKPLNSFNSLKKDQINPVQKNISKDHISQKVDTQTMEKSLKGMLNLVLKAKEEGWIRLTIDDEKTFELTINKDQVYSWVAQKHFELTMMYGKLASVYLNHEEIGIDQRMENVLYNKKLDKFLLTQINN